MESIDDMAARSLRCVAIAYRAYDLDKVPAEEEQLAQWALPEDDLVLLAIVGIKVCIKTAFRNNCTYLFFKIKNYMILSGSWFLIIIAEHGSSVLCG